MRKKELRNALKGLYKFFKDNPKRIGSKDNPLIFILYNQGILGRATVKQVSPLDTRLRVKVEVSSDLFVEDMYNWYLGEFGGVQKYEKGYSFPPAVVRDNDIVMGILKTVGEMQEVIE